MIKNFKLKKAFIVAEAGVNHEGKISECFKLVKAAKNAGADAIKFQSYILDDYIWIKDVERYKRMKKFNITHKQFKKVFDFAKKNKIICFTTPLDTKSIDYFSKISPILKVASGDINNFYHIKKIIDKNLPTIISTGLATKNEILKTYKYIKKTKPSLLKNNKIAFLHCKSSYPCPDDEADLNNIKMLKKIIKCSIGYSDHTLGTLACETAAAMGVKIIEKHFTLKKSGKKFRDHKLSATPTELKKMIIKIRKIENILGNTHRKITLNERENSKYLRRSLFYKKKYKKLNDIKIDDLKILRPCVGTNLSKFKIKKKNKLLYEVEENQPVYQKDFK